MKFNNFVGPSYQLDSKTVSTQRSVNLYPELIEVSESGNKYSLLGTPGIEHFSTMPQSYIRGMWIAKGRWFVVTYSKLLEIDSLGNSTSLGDLPFGTNIVGLSDNGFELAIAMGSRGFIFDLTANTLTEITSDGWRGSFTVTFLDGRFIYTEPESGRFYWSELNDGGNIDPLSFATAEGSPDDLVTTYAAYQQLYAFGGDTLEVYESSGDQDAPYTRIGNAVLEYGCAARYSIAKADNALIWLGKDARGSGVVYAIRGYNGSRISTPAIEQAIQSYPSIDDAVAYSYQEDGHVFYVLNFTSANTTWVYDVSTGFWHERGSLINGTMERHRGNHHVYVFGNHYISDYSNRYIYTQSNSIYYDDTRPIKRIRIAPHLVDDRKRVRYKDFEVNMEVGLGNSLDTSPLAELYISKDAGKTFINVPKTSTGQVGEYLTRVNWHRLGTARDCVFYLDITGRTKVAIVSAFVDMEKTIH